MTNNTFSKTTFIAILVLISFFATAQNKQKWFKQSYGASFATAYDNAFSLVRYKGKGFQIGLGNESESTKKWFQIDNIFSLTPMSGQTQYITGATTYDNRIAVTYLKKLDQFADKKTKIGVGASTYFDGNLRIYNAAVNNNFAWDVNLGLNVVGRAQRAFEFKNRSFSISYTLGLPLIVYNHRPNYLGFGPSGYIVNDKEGNSPDWRSQGRFTTIRSNFFAFNQQLQLDKNYANGNKIRLGYTWKYMHNNLDKRLYEGVVSGFSLGILTNLSKTVTNTSN